MSRFAHLRNFGRLAQNLSLYFRKSNKLDPRAIAGSKVAKTAAFLHTLRAIAMNKETEPPTNSSLNLDEELQKALEDGDTALLNLMEQLKSFVVVISEEYRSCLKKQMEIMEKASSVGPFSEAWDELPQYRSLADELDKQLNEYLAVFNTLGSMAGQKTLTECVSGATENLDLVATKYNELDALLKGEVEKNRRLNSEFLRASRDIILNEISN